MLAVDLASLAQDCADLVSFRARAATLVRTRLEADVAVFATEGGCHLDGLPGPVAATLTRGWARYRGEVATVQAAAMKDGASTDRRVLGRALERTRVFREVMAEVGGVESLFVVARRGPAKLGFLMLGATRRPFSDTALAEARTLAPVLSLACAAQGACVTAPAPLSDVERELVQHLALGHATAQIALARGTSFFTVRNQLSALYRKLGVANRAEALGRLRG